MTSRHLIGCLSLLLALSFHPPAAAHNGAVALAYPMEGIAIDGDLSDWPEVLRWYPVAVTGAGMKPGNREDFAGRFRVGYSPAENALYIAVEARDESLVADPARDANWYAQDGCEVYLDLGHGEQESPLAKYAIYGNYHTAHLTQEGEGVLEDRPEVRLGVRRATGVHQYEWRIAVGALSKGAVQLRGGMSLGFDLALTDADADSSSSWMVWGSAVGKHLSVDRRGDLVLVEETTQTGRLQGRLEWQDTGRGVAYGRIQVRSSLARGLQVQVQTGRDGQYAVELPAGTYQVVPLQGRDDQQPAPVQLAPGAILDVPLKALRSAGRSIPAGPGRALRAGPGTQRGLWWTLGIPDGLSTSLVLTMLQDRRGYLWFGTEKGGLWRYDGQGFVVYTRKDGLAHDWVISLCEDRDGQLWIGTQGGGVCRFDGQAFTTFTTADGLASDFVLSIAEDRSGNTWFGTPSGASCFDGQGFTTYTQAEGLADDMVWAALTDQAGNTWFGTQGGGVTRFDGQAFTTFATGRGLAGNLVRSIAQDRDGNLWFGTQGGGVTRFDGQTFRNYSVADGLSDSRVWAIAQDDEGHLWFATNGGLSCFDGEGFRTYTVEDGLGNNRVRALLQDRQGQLWAGTYEGGITRYAGLRFAHFTTQEGLPGNKVESIHQDQDGDLWFGTDKGMVRYHGRRFETLAPSTRPEYHGDGIPAIATDRGGTLWWGTWGRGLIRYDGRQLTRFTTADGVPHKDVCSLLVSRAGNIWIGTWGGGLGRYDGARFARFTAEDGFPASVVMAALEDRAGNIWLGTDQGLVKYDGSQFTRFTAKDGLLGEQINALLEDRNGYLWLGTAQGLSRFDGRSFRNFTVEDGLAHRFVWCLCEDRSGHLWIGTDGGGASRFDGQNFQTLTQRDGLVHDMVRDIHQDQDGNMWFATDGGLTRYRLRSTPPPVRITDIAADRRYGAIPAITLPVSHAHPSFEFRGLSFSPRPDALLYRYRLDGYDADWHITRSGRAEYQDLRPGTYTFQVQAIDQDLSYSEQPAVVQVQVHPSYAWLAWLAALGLALLLAAWQAVRLVNRGRQLRQANQVLQRQTAALAVINRRLERANREVQQAGEAKNTFLASMSHELRTPMNAILNFSALILDGVYGPIPPDLRDAVDEIDRNSDHLLGLINDILDLSKVEAGALDLQLCECLPQACVETAVSALEHRATQKGLALIHEVEPDLPMLWADERRLTQQVLLNLLRNALKFTDQGEIRVGTRRQGEEVLFWVSDTGIGIPVQEQQRIFESFYQVEGGRSRQVEGTGLGLAIARRFVELHRGRIWVESQVGQGSTFFFTIPLGSRGDPEPHPGPSAGPARLPG